jgi:hypothetical protein
MYGTGLYGIFTMQVRDKQDQGSTFGTETDNIQVSTSRPRQLILGPRLESSSLSDESETKNTDLKVETEIETET